MKNKKRTDVDWSQHELIIKENDDFASYQLKKPGTYCQSIKFINTNGVLVVTGDYSNWLFCREFHPSKGGNVSDGYWCEKLEISSSQKSKEYDSEATRKILTDGLDFELEEYGYSGDELSEMKKYYQELLSYVDCDEWEYTCHAYMEYPGFVDFESVPYSTKTNYILLIVFDAFEEICRRMEKTVEAVETKEERV